MSILVEENILLFDQNIPGFIIPTNLIIINVLINDVPLKALIDTGATMSVLFKNSIKKCKLDSLVDKNYKTNINGINGFNNKLSYGKIWYLDININNYCIPCSFTILDNIDKNIDIILGIDFLSIYNINIDFKNKQLIFESNFKILFDN